MACVPQVCHGLPHIHNQRLALVLRWHAPAHHVYFQRAALINLLGLVTLRCPQAEQVMVIWVGS